MSSPKISAGETSLPGAVKAAQAIFGKSKVRFFGGGCPNVFLDNAGKACPLALEKLLTWSEIS
jgi:hypothetical protein